jgi:hypothetical protein
MRMMRSHFRLALIASLVLGGLPVRGEGVPGMEQCVFPRLLCPSPKGGLPGSGIAVLCEALVKNGATSADACWDFAWQHTCEQLLDAQVRSAGSFGGNCYGQLLTNCCPAAVRVDVSLAPEIGSDDRIKGMVVFHGGAAERTEVRVQRREMLIGPGRDLGVLWVGADDKYYIPGAELRWQVHGIRAADASGDAAPLQPEATRAGSYPEVAFEGGARIFETARRTEVPANRIRHEAGTVSFWIAPRWSRGDRNNADLVHLGNTGFQLVKRGTVLRFEYAEGEGEACDADIAHWQEEERHHVIGTWSASSMELYVDGQQASVSSGGGRAPLPGDGTVYVGTAADGAGATASARISALRIENRHLSFSDVLSISDGGSRAEP